MKINFDNNIPIYYQVLEIIKKDILKGNYKCLERLPSVREFANIYKVNPNTIQKSLMELEKIGLIYTDRTNGKYVTDDLNKIKQIKDSVAKDTISNYFNMMDEIGISKEEAIKYIEKGN